MVRRVNNLATASPMTLRSVSLSEESRKPLVLVPACNRMIGHHPFHVAGRKYIDAVRLAGCQPLVVPSAEPGEIDALLDLADGVLLTGSPSNVHPSHFNEKVHDPSLPLDADRDRWTLSLIPRALERGIPLFGICRGFQETNVALGGSLHQAVQELPGHADHRGPGAIADTDVETQYGPAHPVHVARGGLLASLLGETSFEVNSLHGQGVSRLAEGLRVEALAPDGLVEAFSVPDAPAFNLCVQWHPEWQAAGNPVSMRLLRAFGDACQSYRDRYRDRKTEQVPDR
jgi:putative glutamine amidotransferase